jgi:undecaprenyl-diphosphatase
MTLVTAIRLSPDQFDRPVTVLLSENAGSSRLFDYTVTAIDRFDIFQGVLMLAIGSAALAKAGDLTTRLRLIVGGVAAALAAVLSRILQLLLPYSPRPMQDPDLVWNRPYGADQDLLRDWSSFPSDHACLLFGAAFAIFIVNRRLGGLALAIACVLGLMRVYVGEHYLSDVLGGAFMATFAVAATLQIYRPFEQRLCALVEKHPGLSAAAAFIFFSQAAFLFDDVRRLGVAVAKHLL